MIEYSEKFHFINDVGEFTVTASTEKHPSGYGNSMILRMAIDSDFPCARNRLFDVRYEPIRTSEDVRSIVKSIIYNEFGVEV